MLGESNYTLDIRPTFIEELDAAARYIEQNLKNPQAADDLIERTYSAFDEVYPHARWRCISRDNCTGLI